jgi:hypothetical protein
MTKEEVRSFQDRWLKPVGIVALIGAALVAASVAVGNGVPSHSNSGDQLMEYHDHAGRLELSRALQGLGLALFAAPLYFLFRSAFARPLPEAAVEGRQPRRMRGFLGAFVILGPILAAIGGVGFAFVFSDASDNYIAGVANVIEKAKTEAAKGAPARSANGVATTATTVTHTTTATTTTPKGNTTTKTTTATIEKGACTKPVNDCIDDAKSNFADDTVRDSSGYAPAGIASTLGSLLLVVGGIYTLIWTVRTGLLTRFMATLGIVFIAALIFAQALGQPALVLWFAALGLMFLGVWPRPLPPAWEAGEAIPWMRPGMDIGPPPDRGGDGGTVEGSRREVSERPLPQEGEVTGEPSEPPEPPYGETQGQRRKKRKRRG